MAALRQFKWIIVLLLALLAVVVIALLLIAGDAALSIMDRLAQYPPWVSFIYGGVLIGVALAALLLTWRLMYRGKFAKPKDSNEPSLNENAVRKRLSEARDKGADVADLDQELAELKRRKNLPVIEVALSGRISTGKSTLINALIPGAEAMTSVVGGATRLPDRWRWNSRDGLKVELVDLPGTGGEEPEAIQARAECVRAHVVVYVCDGDLTRQQMQDIDALASLKKPLLIAVNKSDQLNDEERRQVTSKIEERLGSGMVPVVNISAGGEEAILKVDSEGRQTTSTRSRPARIEPLAAALEVLLAERYQELEPLREHAVFADVSERLEKAEMRYREAKASELIDSHSRQAVVGALAAITPGSDLVIQGVLATRLISSLGRLYGVAIGDVEIDKLLRLAGGRLKNATSLTLAIAGNGLKAFPGVGTIAGGLVHAVAYGMIFQSLGKAVAMTLAERAQLAPETTAKRFGELLDDNLEPAAKRFARLALTRGNKKNIARGEQRSEQEGE